MIFILSGEGISDLGKCANAQASCVGDQVLHGPLTLVIDLVVQEVLGYSPLEATPDSLRYISERALLAKAAEMKGQRRIALSGKKHGKETGFFYINAWMLGEISKEVEKEQDDAAVAVLFRDLDGTNSSPTNLWDSKYTSMVSGFESSGHFRGVPMLPRPKSEAWFLCAAKPNPYHHCQVLEERSGNDASPLALKAELANALGEEATADALRRLLERAPFDFARVSEQMPSFARFHNDFRAALLA